jgi:hypothetical protein
MTMKDHHPAEAPVAWTHDAENYGNALNEAAWVFVDECPEKSVLLFNNTKAPLRAAILKYAEAVTKAAKHEPVAWYVFADSEHWLTLDEDEAASNRSQGFQVRPLIFQDSLRPDPEGVALRADLDVAKTVIASTARDSVALIATLARVRALADEWNPLMATDPVTRMNYHEFGNRLRAALEGSNRGD